MMIRVETLLLDGRYRVLRMLGTGAMGEVYLVEHALLGRKEALKIVRPELVKDEQLVARFRREARATNRVQHLNVVSVYDFGRLSNGRFYLSMEYVEGETLRATLERDGRIPVRRAIHILVQLCEAIAHAHQHGVIHRDLKPENMLLTKHRGADDVVKVLDFGIAKIFAPDHQDSIGISVQGEVFGTPNYMAPETIEGKESNPLLDIYAFGCIAYEILTGAPPFVGRQIEVLHAHVTQMPQTLKEAFPLGNYSPAVEEIVRRCLEKLPEKRFQTAVELLAAIRAAASSVDVIEAVGLDASIGEEEQTRIQETRYEPSDLGLEDIVSLRRQYQGTVCEVAEAILDQGTLDVDLVVALAEAKAREVDLNRVDRERVNVQLRFEELDQFVRTREGSLRFTIGELQFAREQAKVGGKPAVENLEQRLAAFERELLELRADYERKIEALDKAAIELAAQAASAEDRARDAFLRLSDLVDAAAKQGMCDELIPSLAQLRKARKGLGS